MLDERGEGGLEAVVEPVDRVGRPLFERTDVDLPFDTGELRVEVRPHQREPLEHPDAVAVFFSHCFLCDPEGP
jgi:hypothetical protein